MGFDYIVHDLVTKPMKITHTAPAHFPEKLNDYIKNQATTYSTPSISSISPTKSHLFPGFILGMNEITKINPVLKEQQSSALVIIPPQDGEKIFNDDQIDLIKYSTKLLAKSIDQHMGITVSGLWLLYDAQKLIDYSQNSNRDDFLTFLKIFGLATGIANEINSELPSAIIPESLITTLDFAAISGKSIYLGKSIPTNEFILSQQDKGTEILVQLLKCGGIALDPAPSHQALYTQPLFPIKK